MCHVAGALGDVLVSASFKGHWKSCEVKKRAVEVTPKMQKVPYRKRLGYHLSSRPKKG